MWVMKLKLDSSKQLMGQMAMKYQVSMTGYPLSYYKDDKYLYLINAGVMLGEEKKENNSFPMLVRVYFHCSSVLLFF